MRLLILVFSLLCCCTALRHMPRSHTILSHTPGIHSSHSHTPPRSRSASHSHTPRIHSSQIYTVGRHAEHNHIRHTQFNPNLSSPNNRGKHYRQFRQMSPSGGQIRRSPFRGHRFKRQTQKEFEWSVKDPESGNDYGHSQSRMGDQVVGTYYALLPDGRMQRVDYSSGPSTGFVAKVSYITPDDDSTSNEGDKDPDGTTKTTSKPDVKQTDSPAEIGTRIGPTDKRSGIPTPPPPSHSPPRRRPSDAGVSVPSSGGGSGIPLTFPGEGGDGRFPIIFPGDNNGIIPPVLVTELDDKVGNRGTNFNKGIGDDALTNLLNLFSTLNPDEGISVDKIPSSFVGPALYGGESLEGVLHTFAGFDPGFPPPPIFLPEANNDI